jgi:3-oxoadipate enol-lactonase
MGYHSVRLKDGSTLACRIEGSGPPLVWSHGMLASTAVEDAAGFLDWKVLAAQRCLVRYDARGHGASSSSGRSADQEWHRLADDLIQILDDLGFPCVTLGGDSMGCGIALHLAVAAPERVNGLVLAVPPAAWEQRPAIARIYRTAARVVASPAGLLLQGLGSIPAGVLGGSARLPAVTLKHLASLSRSDIAAILQGASQSDLPNPEVIRRLDVPTLVLAWRGDRVHPATTAERLAELLPQSELRIEPRPGRSPGWTAQVLVFLPKTVASAEA